MEHAVQPINEIRPAEHISIAQLFSAIPMSEVKAALCAADANDQRERDLPSRFMVYFVIAMSLYSNCSATEVFRSLVETLKLMFGVSAELKIPAKSSFTYARKKIGSQAFRNLFASVVRPIAKPGQTVGAFFKNRRLVAIDGVQFNIQDTPENDANFGRAKTSSGPAAFPAVRCVGLVELGTHVLFEYEFGAAGGPKEQSENALAQKVLPKLSSEHLCIADRLYSNYLLWEKANATGAALLWRIKSDVRLDEEMVLEDGSYLSRLYDGDRRKSTTYAIVRVIEYAIGEQKYRLITNLLSVAEASNDELARLYCQRWEYETTNKEQKHGLNAYVSTLRSRTAELVEQELIALFLMHYAVRVVMHDAALSIGEDVDRLSFKHALSVIRRRAPFVGAFPPRRSLRGYC